MNKTGVLLKKITVKGFKYFNEQITLNLDYNIIVLIGPVGSGKSSLLEAIEYALFGTTYDIKKSRILTINDIINDFSNTLQIELDLEEAGNIYKIIRSISNADELKTNVILLENNKRLQNVSISRYIEKILGITFEDFCRQIFIRQRELSALIYGQPYQRSEAMDRLLGISILEHIFRSISFKDINNLISNLEKRRKYLLEEIKEYPSRQEIENKIEFINDKIKICADNERELRDKIAYYMEIYENLKSRETRYTELKSQLSLIRSLIKKYIQNVEKREYIDLEELNNEIDKIKSSLVNRLRGEMFTQRAQKLEEEFSLIRDFEKKVSLLEENIDILKSRNRFLKSKLYEMMNEMIPLKTNYNEKISRLGNIKNNLIDLEVYVNRYKELIEKYGTLVKVEGRIREKELKEKSVEYRIKENVCKEIILNLLRKKLERKKKDNRVKCPICGSLINSAIISKIEYSEDIQNLRKMLENIRKEKEELKKVFREIEELEKKVEIYQKYLSEKEKTELEISNLYEKIENLGELIEETKYRINDLENFVYVTSKNLNDIKSRYEIFKKRSEIEKLRKMILRIENEIKTLNYRPELIKDLEEKIVKLRKKLDQIRFEKNRLERELERSYEILKNIEKIERELKNIEERVDILKLRKKMLNNVKNAFRIVQRRLRKKMLKKIVNLMNYVFSRIYVYNDYNALDIKVKEEKIIRENMVYERSIYLFYAKRTIDNKWIDVAKKMSEGQKNIVALAFLIALFKVFPHKIMFIILDEPVPNVDKKCREALIRMISEMKELKQIIIATQDNDFINIVKEIKPPLTGCVYSFSHGEKQPIVKKILVK